MRVQFNHWRRIFTISPSTTSVSLSLVVAAILFFDTVACPAQGIYMREGFEEPNLAQWALSPCYRPENSITRSPPPNSGKFSARLEVWPLGKTQSAQEPLVDGVSCLDADRRSLPFVADGTERAEIWVPAARRLPADTDLWYGFSMLIDGQVKDDEPRLVIGQWKQSIGKSPIIAQRFKNKTFAITAEQDGPNALVCRILVAYQHGRVKPQEDSFVHGDPASTSTCMNDTEVVQPDGASGPAATLPDPFAGDCWVDMIYHLRASSEEAGKLRPDGVLEVWANGAPIAVLHGRIGYYSADPTKREIFFKFGPYRDAGTGRDYTTTVYFDSFTRGSSYSEVDPANFPGRGLVALCR
jgi:hypothetical protein